MLKASIADVRASDTMSMFGSIIAIFGLFIAIFPTVMGVIWVRIIYIIFCISGYFLIKNLEKWFNYSGMKLMVLNICLGILEIKCDSPQ